MTKKLTEKQNRSERVWEVGRDGHEKAQLQSMSRLSLIEKIKWLEEAQEVFNNLAHQKDHSRDSKTS